MLRYLILALMISGCVTAIDAPPSQDELDKAGAACMAYGFKPGTNEIAQCMATNIRGARIQKQQRMQAVGEAMQNYGDSMQASRPIQTNCTSYYNNLSCTTY